MRPASSLAAPFAVFALLVALLGTGCVSKSDHEALQAELDACREATAAAEADAARWQQRFDRESMRWEEIGTSVEDALPRALNELEDERRELLEAVPAQVQDEVVAYLDEYRNAMMAGVRKLQDDNQEIKTELLASRMALEALGADTRSIGQAIDSSLAEERARLTDERSKRDEVTRDLANVIDLVVEFDATRLNCNDCPNRLRMRDRSREEISAFHAELIQDLNRIATFSRASLPAVGNGAGDSAVDGQAEADAADAATEGR